MKELERVQRAVCWLQCIVLLQALAGLIQAWRIHEVERLVYSLQDVVYSLHGLVHSLNSLVSAICRILIHHC